MKSFAKYLPSKGFLAISGATVLSISLIGMVFIGSRSEVPNRELAIPTLALVDETTLAIQKELGESDQDNDGLKDWEEALWGTNPKISDSDGDGTNDGDEVKVGRNPTIRGPRDSIEIQKDSDVKTDVNIELTTTDKISRVAFSRYIQLKQGGGEIDDEFQKQLISEVVHIQNQDLKPGRTYTLGDLIVIEDTNENARGFASKMGEIIKTANLGVDELTLIKEALDKEDPEMLKKLNPTIQSYKKILNDSLTLNVPTGLTRDHLGFLNSVTKIITTLEAMEGAFKDPALALALFGKYPEHFTEMHRAFISIQGYYTRNNISFKDSESGFIYAHFADIIENAAQRQTI